MNETSNSGSRVLERDNHRKSLSIDFLYSDDCPSHERALALVQDVLQEEGVEAQLTLHRIETEEEAEQHRFPGSPTIRVQNVDIDETPDLPVGLTCRAYRHENGRISPLPPRQKLVGAIRRAAANAPFDATGNAAAAC